MRRFLVASCLAEVTQQIHSFRASGVISAHRLLAAALDSIAFRKSAGILWTVPFTLFLVVTPRSYYVPPKSRDQQRLLFSFLVNA